MKKLALIVGLIAVLSASAFAEPIVTMELVGPAGVVTPGDSFTVDVILTSDTPLSIVQAVLAYDTGAMMLYDATSTQVALAVNVYASPPFTAFVDPSGEGSTIPSPLPGPVVAMTLHFTSDVNADGTYALDLVLIPGNLGPSSYVFDEAFTPSWNIDTISGGVTFGTAVIPEPFTVGLFALVGLGGVLAGRKRK
jgi:hypothetical protein